MGPGTPSPVPICIKNAPTSKLLELAPGSHPRGQIYKKGRGAAVAHPPPASMRPQRHHPLGPLNKLRGGGPALHPLLSPLCPTLALGTPSHGAWLCVPGSPPLGHNMYAPARWELENCSRRAGTYINSNWLRPGGKFQSAPAGARANLPMYAPTLREHF